jgi:hypothetical protein
VTPLIQGDIYQRRSLLALYSGQMGDMSMAIRDTAVRTGMAALRALSERIGRTSAMWRIMARLGAVSKGQNEWKKQRLEVDKWEIIIGKNVQ